MSKLLLKGPKYTDHLAINTVDSSQERLESAQNALDADYFADFLEDSLNPNPLERKWRHPPVSFDTFIDSPKYLGQGSFVYPEIRNIGRSVIEGGYGEGIVVAGIGSGKTTVAELIAVYLTHWLLCMRDPYHTFQLAKDKPIAMINMGTTATQALEVAFEGIKNFIKNSPWMMSFNPKITSGKIIFPDHNILLVAGNSKATTPLGYNVFYAVLDEAAFYLDNDQKQVAEEIYMSLQRRIVSRFGYEGLIMMISSPLYEGDFIMAKLKEAKEKFQDQVFAQQLPTWRGKPMSKADMTNKFYFDSRANKIMTDAPDDMSEVSLASKNFDPDLPIWEIPGEYRKSFEQDPDRAKRDLAGIPSGAIEAFIGQRELVDMMFTEQESPVTDQGYEFPEDPLRTQYFIHVDLALNKNGGDCAGLAMAHLAGWRENEHTGEKEKLVEVDLAEQISAGPSGEVDFEEVRNRIYALKALGYNIKLVTFDQYQSVDSRQILRSKGIRSDLLSVDRTITPYNTLKTLIYSQRIKCHQMPILAKELKQLEITKSMKVDHPPKGSKDVADAVCGAVYNVIEHTGAGNIGIATGGFNKINTPEEEKKVQQARRLPGQTGSERPELTEHYKQVQDLIDQGLI